MWRGEVRRGRAGQAFDFGEPGVLDGATAKSLAAGRHGPRQVGQIVKPLRGSPDSLSDPEQETVSSVASIPHQSEHGDDRQRGSRTESHQNWLK